MKIQQLINNIKKLNSNKNFRKNHNLFLNLGEYLNVLQKIKINQYFPFSKSFLKKRNPFFLIRKNFKIFYKKILINKILTPNLLKFLHLTLFSRNIENYWRLYFPFNILEILKLKFKKQQYKSSNDLSYIFSLIIKNNYIKNILNFNINSNIPFYNILKNLYFLNSYKTKNFLSLKKAKFLSVNHEKKNFNKFFILSFKERNYLQKIIQFYYPLLSILIKERAIHSLPLKTKKPRRV